MDRATQLHPIEWHSLDATARANLQGPRLQQFFSYRDSLYFQGHSWDDDAKVVLTGFIWDESADRD